MDAVFKAVFGNEMPAVIFIINAFGIYFKLFLLPRSLYRSKKSDRCESHRRHSEKNVFAAFFANLLPAVHAVFPGG